MTSIPPFSIFSAVSELFVTAGVLVVIRRNWARRSFPFALFLTVALFEALVNVMYMATRAAQVSGGAHPLAPAMRVFFAAHGMLSLLAYVVFVVLGVVAYQDQKAGRFFFPDHPKLTASFLILWIVSIGSGEILFALRYLV
jgi:uncharacterized membrane protein YozB (DUF420 family)